MRYVVVLMGVVLVFTARASAQEEAGAASDEVASTATDAKPEESPVQQEPANPPQEE